MPVLRTVERPWIRWGTTCVTRPQPVPDENPIGKTHPRRCAPGRAARGGFQLPGILDIPTIHILLGHVELRHTDARVLPPSRSQNFRTEFIASVVLLWYKSDLPQFVRSKRFRGIVSVALDARDVSSSPRGSSLRVVTMQAAGSYRGVAACVPTLLG